MPLEYSWCWKGCLVGAWLPCFLLFWDQEIYRSDHFSRTRNKTECSLWFSDIVSKWLFFNIAQLVVILSSIFLFLNFLLSPGLNHIYYAAQREKLIVAALSVHPVPCPANNIKTGNCWHLNKTWYIDRWQWGVGLCQWIIILHSIFIELSPHNHFS